MVSVVGSFPLKEMSYIHSTIHSAYFGGGRPRVIFLNQFLYFSSFYSKTIHFITRKKNE